MEVQLPFAYSPRDYQIPLFRAFDQGYKRFVLCWHRRCGKDLSCFNLMARAMFQRVGSYFYIFPSYAQGKKVIWDGATKEGFRFLHHIPKSLWQGKPNQTEMKIRVKNGSLFQVIGSDNIDSVVGTNPVGVIFSEMALQDPRAWDFIRPILAENDGWALFNSTPRGRYNYFYNPLWLNHLEHPSEWWGSRLTVENTGAITLDQIEAERRAGMSEELIQQEFYCDWSGGMQGSYYADQIELAEEESRITDLPYDREIPVDTWWDLGMNDSTTILFTQQHFSQIRVIDCYENSGKGLDHYADVLRQRGYFYRDHVGPHDLAVRELGTGKSRIETAKALGVDFKVARKLPVNDGINAVRAMLYNCVFDREKTKPLVNALMAYRKEYDSKSRIFKDKPFHDLSSHFADAMRTGAVGRRSAKIERTRERYTPYGQAPRKKGWMAY